MSCGADTEANALLLSLTDGVDFELPDIDMSGPDWDLPGGANNPALGEITRLDNDALTTKTVDGSGTFDYLMKSVSVHLLAEFKSNRITGADYVKAYIELTAAAMGNATQFLIQRDAAFYQAAMLQMQLLTQRAALAVAKAQFVTMKYDALTAKANYAHTKMRMATESMGYCTAKYSLENMLPQQLLLLEEQTLTAAETTKLTSAQITLVNEQMESQRAQSSDTRSTGEPVAGLTGKQKDLYTQQITSYKRDAEVKAAKLFTDAWITQKTIDEGLVAPPNFTNSSLDDILGTLKTNNELGTP